MKLLLLLTLSLLFTGVSFADLPKCRCDKSGEQIECDESKTEDFNLKAGECLNKCHCSKGHVCKWGKHVYKKGICVKED